MNHEITDLLYQALDATLGLVVATSDPVSLRARLYAAMKADPDLACFSIHISRTNPGGELIILRKVADADLQQTHDEPAGGGS